MTSLLCKKSFFETCQFKTQYSCDKLYMQNCTDLFYETIAGMTAGKCWYLSLIPTFGI